MTAICGSGIRELKELFKEEAVMIECGSCNGTGLCHNPIHKEEGHFELTPDPFALWATCEECGEKSISPGVCFPCGGKGHYENEA